MADFLAGAGEPEDADAVPATDGPAPTGTDGAPAEPAVALASPTSVAAGEAAGSPTDASGRRGGRGLGRGTSSGRGLGRGRSAGRGLHGHDASKRASNGFLDEANTDLEVYGNGEEEDAETLSEDLSSSSGSGGYDDIDVASDADDFDDGPSEDGAEAGEAAGPVEAGDV